MAICFLMRFSIGSSREAASASARTFADWFLMDSSSAFISSIRLRSERISLRFGSRVRMIFLRRLSSSVSSRMIIFTRSPEPISMDAPDFVMPTDLMSSFFRS